MKTKIAQLIFLSIVLIGAGQYAYGGDVPTPPIANKDVTSMMDDGSTEIPAYYLAQGTITLSGTGTSPVGVFTGYENPNNNLVVSGILTTDENGYYLGYGKNSSGNILSVLRVMSSDGSKFVVPGLLNMGYLGSNNSISVSNSARITASAIEIGHGSDLDESEGCGNAMTIHGVSASATITDGGLLLGVYGSSNSLVISEGATCDVAGNSVILGQGSSGEATLGLNNSALVSGAGSRLNCANGLVIGQYGSGNTVTVEKSGLLCSANISIAATDGAADNYLRINSGYLALKGDVTSTVNDMISAGGIKVWDHTANDYTGGWITATAAELSIDYCADEASAKSITADNDFKGYSDLAGYTIIRQHSNGPKLNWAGKIYDCGNNQYYSSWYGWFVMSPDDYNTIFSYNDFSWQYIFPDSTPENLYMFDYLHGSWLYTNKEFFGHKYVYCFTENAWIILKPIDN